VTVSNNYLLQPMTDDNYEALAANYLTALARRDMIVWSGHRSVWDVGASNSSVKGSAAPAPPDHLEDADPVTVRLTDDERLRLERTDRDLLNGY
jgi:hypothetical protein